MNEAHRRGARALPSRRRDPIPSWSKLSNGDTISVYRGPELVASGKIDMLAADGSVLWIIDDDGRGRSLFLNEDGFNIIKRQAVRRNAHED